MLFESVIMNTGPHSRRRKGEVYYITITLYFQSSRTIYNILQHYGKYYIRKSKKASMISSTSSSKAGVKSHSRVGPPAAAIPRLMHSSC